MRRARESVIKKTVEHEEATEANVAVVVVEIAENLDVEAVVGVEGGAEAMAATNVTPLDLEGRRAPEVRAAPAEAPHE